MVDIRPTVESIRALPDEKQTEAAIDLLCCLARKHNNLIARYEVLRDEKGPEEPFPLMKLPCELREEIYVHALRANTDLLAVYHDHGYIDDEKYDNDENGHKPPTPALIYVNKEVHAEAIDVLYGRNNLLFFDPQHVHQFQSEVNLDSLKKIRRVSIEIVNTLDTEKNNDLLDRWITALDACLFTDIIHFGFSVNNVLDNDSEMESRLTEAIIRFLNKVLQKNPDRQLILRLPGFFHDDDDCKLKAMFPEFNVVSSEWYCDAPENESTEAIGPDSEIAEDDSASDDSGATEPDPEMAEDDSASDDSGAIEPGSEIVENGFASDGSEATEIGLGTTQGEAAIDLSLLTDTDVRMAKSEFCIERWLQGVDT